MIIMVTYPYDPALSLQPLSSNIYGRGWGYMGVIKD